MKVPTTTPNSSVVIVPEIAAQDEQDQTVVETWVLWLTDDVFITGTDKPIVELIAAFLVKDIARLEQISEQLGIDPKKLFGENYATLTYAKIAEIAFETLSIHQLSYEKLLELIKKGGKKGRTAV